MAQGDMNIANQGFPAFRADLNDQLEALVTNSSGATAPATTFPHQWWLDTSTTPSTLRQRNAANDAWIVIGLVDQSANKLILSNPEYTGTLTGGTGVINIGSGQLYKDASGNVGIGTSSPGRRLAVIQNNASQINFGTAADSGGFLISTGDGQAIISGGAFWNGSAWQAASTSAQLIGQSNGRIEFSTNAGLTVGNTFTPTERARIDSNGSLLVGTTSNPIAGSASTIVANGYGTRSGVNGSYSGFRFLINWTGSPQLWIDATNVGTISTTSDYRTKKNVEAQTKPAIDRVLQLRPVKYELTDYGTLFKADGVMREGFIAHELQEVIPSAVDGEKDAPDQIQSLKLDALCAVLTKAIQEQQAIIDSLKARLDAANL
jgi:hypothetical protein